MLLQAHLSQFRKLASGLRVRLVVTLCAVVVPVLALALCWTYYELSIVSQARFSAVEGTAELAAGNLDGMLRSVRTAQRVLIASSDSNLPPAGACGRFRPILRNVLGVDVGVASYSNGRMICSSRGMESWLNDSLADQLAERAAAGADPAVASTISKDFPLAVGLSHGDGRAQDLLVVAIARDQLERLINLPAFGNALGAAVLANDGQIIGDWPLARQSWLPKNREGLIANQREGQRKARDTGTRLIVAPIGKTHAAFVVGYTTTPIRAIEQRQFYQVALCFFGVMAAMIIGIIWAVDRSMMRWIIYLRRIAIAHSKGRWSVRALHLETAPHEMRELGNAINHMAAHMSDHAGRLETALSEKALLLRELHHRVKNNFQVIASLLSLHKKGLPPERWNETRFIEEHVRAMAIAYRTSYATGDPKGVPPLQLIRDVIEAMREAANIRPDCVKVIAEADNLDIDLDKAISLGLYVAYFLPPYLTRDINNRRPLTIEAGIHADFLVIRLTNLPEPERPHASLRQRLSEAYGRQLGAFTRIPAEATEMLIEVPIQQREELEAALS